MKTRYYVFIIGIFIFLTFVVLLYGTKLFQKKQISPPDLTCDHCNILLLDIDTLRADELPCYGYFRDTSPNLCAFAEKSVIFTDNYSQGPWTLPSIFSTITSLYPTFHKVRVSYVDKLSSDIPTIAETLQRAGYTTIIAGGLNGTDTAVPSQINNGLRGYDQVITDKSYEQIISDLSFTTKPWFLHLYISDLHLPYLLPEDVKPMENLDAPKNLPITNYDFDRLLNIYIKKHSDEIFNQKAKDKYKSIINAPARQDDTRLSELFYKLGKKNEYEYLLDSWKPRYNTYMESFDRNKKSDVEYVRMMYDTKIKILDTKIKSLFQTVDSKTFSKNTITVVMSDHGEAFGKHGVFAHDDSFHSELYYTPLIIHSPNIVNKRIEQPSSNMDIFPTLLELTGIKSLSGLQGHSLVPLMNNQESSMNSFIISEDTKGGIILQNRTWLYFLPFWASTIEQSILYNKNTDPQEGNNVASKFPALTQVLFEKAYFMRSYQTVSPTTNQPHFNNELKIDQEKFKRLQKEGYF